MEPMALDAASTGSPLSSVSALVERARSGDQASFEVRVRERVDLSGPAGLGLRRQSVGSGKDTSLGSLPTALNAGSIVASGLP